MVVLHLKRVLSAMLLWPQVAASALHVEREWQQPITYVVVAVLHLRQVQSSVKVVEINDNPKIYYDGKKNIIFGSYSCW